MTKIVKMQSNSKTGFTLIETITAFAIISIILVVALIGFNTIASVDIRAQEWNAADETIENFIAMQVGGQATLTNDDAPFSITVNKGEQVFIIDGFVRTYIDNNTGRSISVFLAKEELDRVESEM